MIARSLLWIAGIIVTYATMIHCLRLLDINYPGIDWFILLICLALPVWDPRLRMLSILQLLILGLLMTALLLITGLLTAFLFFGESL